MSDTYRFSLPNVRCVNCIRPIEDHLRACQERLKDSASDVLIERFSIDVTTKILSVTVTANLLPALQIQTQIRTLLQEKGIQCVDLALPHKKNLRSHWFLGLLGTLTGLAVLILNLATGGLPLVGQIVIAAIGIPLTLVLGFSSYVDALKKLFMMRTLTMDSLFTMSTLTIVGVSAASLFVPFLPTMIDAGLLIFGFRHIGYAIEESLKDVIGFKKTFQDRIPASLMMLDGGERPIHDIRVGDMVIIEPGQLIPLDGVYTGKGNHSIIDTIITGSSWPRIINPEGELKAGMFVPQGGGPLHMRVSAEAKDSYLATLDAKLAQAIQEKAPLENAANKILQYFIPTVIGLAIVSGMLVGHFFGASLAIQCAVSVLVSACPCTLGFITPLAVKIGMTKAVDHGVRFKSAKTLQEADEIDRVVFDLNGTLTQGEPAVSVYQSHDPDFFKLLYAIEKDSAHPIAKAICDFVGTQGVSSVPTDWIVDPHPVENHSGLLSAINGSDYVLGNEDMMRSYGVALPALNLKRDVPGAVIYLAKGKQLTGYIVLEDPIRSDARQVIDSLRAMGKHVYLCTGADQRTAQWYAHELGIAPHNMRAGCRGSDDKPAYIRQLKEGGRHRVAFVGDGPNDAVVITASDFGLGVASKGSDEITLQGAGAVIQSGSLWPVANAFEVAKQAVKNIKQNLLMSLGYNLGVVFLSGGLLLGVGVTLNPGVGVALMTLQTCFLLYSAYCFKEEKLAHLQQALNQRNLGPGSYDRIQVAIGPRLQHREGFEAGSPIFPVGCGLGYKLFEPMMPLKPPALILSNNEAAPMGIGPNGLELQRHSPHF